MNAAHIAADEYYGVDIAAHCLIEAAKVGAIPVLIRKPEDVTLDAVDLFISTATFQHFPGVDYARRVLEIAYNALRPDGLALVQIRIDTSARPAPERPYREVVNHACVFTDFGVELTTAGFTVLFVERYGTNDYRYFGAQRA